MRVTSEMMVTSSLRRLNGRLQRYEEIQAQLATGKRSAAPSDDPGAAARALSLRASQRTREQEARNAADARSWLDIADSQLQAGVTRLQRARDLAVRAATEIDATEAGALARELRAIQDELVSIANFQHRGRPIFAGSQATPPIASTGEPPGRVWTTSNDDGAVLRRVGEDDVVQVNVTADAVLGFRPGDGGDVLSDLDDLITALETGDTAAVSAGLERLDAARTRFNDALATIGTATNRVDSAERRSADALHAVRVELSEVEDADLAETVVALQVQQTAYQATLQAMARALPPSLASFLR